jgi:predicted TIM-barrel enzyme/DNA-binding NtrC family response regulator
MCKLHAVATPRLSVAAEQPAHRRVRSAARTVLNANQPCPVREHGRFLLGAAIGTGMAAKAAERGGADFLLALSAGRFRSMGAPSAACMLAMRDANELVMEFARAEVLTRTSLPVYFGACAVGVCYPEGLLSQIAECGFHGVTNFPSCIFLDGRYRQYLESSNLGFQRELALLRAARAAGLSTLAYVRTLEEARCAAASGVDAINLDFGWNTGGRVGVENSVNLAEATAQARDFVRTVRALSPGTFCLIEGGPIVTPEQMDQVCRTARADGYIGGSTIDRVPLENAIEMTTNAFKTVGRLRQQIETLEKRLHRRAGVEALIGFSEAMERAREQTSLAMDGDLPVLIVGEPGTGRSSIAQVIHEARTPRERRLVVVDCSKGSREDLKSWLFGREGRPGALERARGSGLLLRNVDSLDATLQRRLLIAAQSGRFRSGNGQDALPLQARLIGTCRDNPDERPERKPRDANFFHWLGTVRIELPPLREHLEDLPMLADALLRATSAGEKKRIDPPAYRLLLGYPWPGNLAELRSVLRTAASAAHAGVIRDANVLRLLRSVPASDRKTFTSERDWIIDGLRRNRFRRAETAQFLRISRKTLYNKLRRYGVSIDEVRTSATRLKTRRVRKPA